MSKRTLIIVLLFGLSLSLAYPRGLKSVFSLQNPTIPTRTPTPAPDDDDDDDGGGDSGSNPPPATDTPQATATATATAVPVTIAATPEGGFLPTAVPCGNQPTLQAVNPTNVRRGPGTDYEIVGRLVYLEVRFILGRADDAEWWLIELEDGQQGWVADDVVAVQGYTDIIPVVAVPAIDGDTPTPGTPWNPTPPPFCTVTPTATWTATATPTPTVTWTPTISATAETLVLGVTGTEDDTSERAAEASPTATGTPTVVVPPTTVPSVTADAEAVAAAGTGDGTPAAAGDPLDVTPPATTPSFLPIAGLLLLAAGILVMFVRRRNQQEE